jgi:hypothetical protein
LIAFALIRVRQCDESGPCGLGPPVHQTRSLSGHRGVTDDRRQRRHDLDPVLSVLNDGCLRIFMWLFYKPAEET